MKSTSISTVVYNPGDPGGISNFPDLVRFLRDENLKLSNALRQLTEGHYDPMPAPPTRPRAGDVRCADGINWNPGAGEGLYRYSIAGAWVFVG